MSAARALPAHIDEYQLRREIGRGAMGSVYLAHDGLLEREVALKLISPRELDAESKAWFFREARALARLSHPNIVTVHRVGEVEGAPYLVTELVRGGSLNDLEKPVPPERVLAIGIGVARGLSAAHRRNVLHRDIKPGNVMLGEGGEVKLVDFGLAKLLEEAGAERAPRIERAAQGRLSVLSQSGEVIGTPLYMAPEALRGEPATALCDIYSAGAVLYELVTGVAPRETLPEKTPLDEWISASPRRIEELSGGASVDPRLSRIIHRCLAGSPDERFPSAEALAAALEALLDSAAEGSVPDGNPYRGLEPFESAHRGLFFGRDAETRAVLRRLEERAIVVVAGDSGAGKSSLCKAGVLPRAASGALGHPAHIVSLVPGERPMQALEHALRGVLPEGAPALAEILEDDRGALYRELARALPEGESLLVFVDQLEELCTLGDAAEARRFAEAIALACAGPRVRALLTLRGDFITSIAALGPLGTDLAASLFLLRPMTEENVRAAITRPALCKGVTFESEELVDELVRAATETPGALPLLEFAMAELWEARDAGSDVLTAAALRRIGSVAGALARHADAVLGALGPDGAAAARRVLLKLVTADRTRARRTFTELGGDDPAARAAIEALVAGRLVVARKLGEERVYEVAHEALLREWQTLRRWLDETAEQQELRDEIDQAASVWARRGRREEETWAGEALSQAVRRAASFSLDLAPAARAFLDAGLARERGAQRRRRVLIAAGTGVLAAVAIASTVAAIAFAEKERQAIAQQEQIRLAAADMGELDLILEPFDWDPASQKATPAKVPSSMDFRLYAADAVDARSPGRLYGADDRHRSMRASGDTSLRERIEARSGPAFLEVTGRGEGCGSSWLYLRRLPGYTDRVSQAAPATWHIPVPTCQATRADTIEVPAGEFYRNVESPEVGAKPVDEIATLPAYSIDRTEVTRRAFAVYGELEALTGDGAARTAYLDLERPGGERLPIVGLSSLTAANYCRFMGKELPSLDQWLKAMRGGLTVGGAPNPDPKRLVPWSKAVSRHPANWGAEGDGAEDLAVVGTFPEDVSPYGAVDMAGNVSEWSREETDYAPMRGLRVILGAAWDVPVEHARWRNLRPERYLDFTIGIRCVRP